MADDPADAALSVAERMIADGRLHAVAGALSLDGMGRLDRLWPFWRRPDQAVPGGDWRTWLVMAGRGFGKTRMNGEMVAITSKDSGGWRELLSGAGTRSLSVSGAGVFTGSAAEARVKANALAGVLDDYRLAFESGATMTGRFLVTRLDYAGDYNGERSYTLSLESSGVVVSA